MIYYVEDRSDLSGVSLAIRFPEEKLDRKALYTVQAELPEFLVPFRYRNVDGQIECVYQPGNRNKLLYYLGSRSPEEYVRFWEHILNPLLECGDWFCKPSSFVLDLPYLYVDKDSGTVSYLYVPSNEDCMETDALKNMAIALSHQATVTDQALENQVLRALMQDFQPRAFLQMLRQSVVRKERMDLPAPATAPLRNSGVPVSHAEDRAELPPVPAASPASRGLDDIEINLDGSPQKPKREKGHGLFGGRGKKEPKKEKEKKAKKGGLFGKKEPKSDEIMLGAGAEMPATPVAQHQLIAPVYYSSAPEDDDATQVEEEVSGPHLKRDLNGDIALPETIPVQLETDGMFTIGRYDVSVGVKQSSFEFGPRTKAVSRRHAAITRMPDGSYGLSDIGSSAGTYLNEEKLVKNVQYRLKKEDKVAFGRAGANYIWEE